MTFDFEKGMGNRPDTTGGATMKFDPTNVRGMEKYKSGDKVTAQVDFTMGDVGEDGQVEVTVDRIVAESINPAKSAGRDMMGGRKPSMAGTAMESDEE
jgi:hypothetical protein